MREGLALADHGQHEAPHRAVAVRDHSDMARRRCGIDQRGQRIFWRDPFGPVFYRKEAEGQHHLAMSGNGLGQQGIALGRARFDEQHIVKHDIGARLAQVVDQPRMGFARPRPWPDAGEAAFVDADDRDIGRGLPAGQRTRQIELREIKLAGQFALHGECGQQHAAKQQHEPFPRKAPLVQHRCSRPPGTVYSVTFRRCVGPHT